MNILEYQAKNICSDYGISVPKSILLLQTSGIKETEAFLRFPIALKAQVYSKRRARTGGISLARSVQEAACLCARMFVSEVQGEAVDKILAEEMIDFDAGYALRLEYAPHSLSIQLSASRSLKSLDENGSQADESLRSTYFSIDPLLGISDATIIELALILELEKKHWENFNATIKKMWRMFDALDTKRIVLNPLVIGADGIFYALGVDINFDHNAAFRQPGISNLAVFGFLDETRSTLRKLDCDYRLLNGNIGVVSQSMQMSVTISDILASQNQRVSELISIGAGATAENVFLILEHLEHCARSKLVIIHSIGDQQENNNLFDGIKSYVNGSDHPIRIITCINTVDQGDEIDVGESGKIVSIRLLSELEMAIKKIDLGKQ